MSQFHQNRIKTLSIFTSLFLLGRAILLAQETPIKSDHIAPFDSLSDIQKQSEKEAAPLRVITNPAFGVGERLKYTVRFGPIQAGYTQIEIPEIVQVNGRRCYYTVTEIWTNSFFSRFHKIEDRVQSFLDVDGIFSWRLINKQREGGYRDDHVTEFDQINHFAVTTKESKHDTVITPPFVQDMLSATYYLRTLDFSPGDSVIIDVHSNRKVYPLRIAVHGREKIKSRVGKFECLVIEPFLREPTMYQQRGRIIVHLTDDRYKIPIRITTKLYVANFNIGDVVATLEEVEGVPGF